MPRSRTQMDHTGEPYVDWIRSDRNLLKVKCMSHSTHTDAIHVVAKLTDDAGELRDHAIHEVVRIQPDERSKTVLFELSGSDDTLQIDPIVPVDPAEVSNKLAVTAAQQLELEIRLIDVEFDDRVYDEVSIPLEAESDTISTGKLLDESAVSDRIVNMVADEANVGTDTAREELEEAARNNNLKGNLSEIIDRLK